MLRNVLREPLLHFLIAGLALFALAQWHQAATDRHRIIIDAAKLAELKNAYEAEFGSQPKPDVLPRLIQDHVLAEAKFREGVARGLDSGDEIVRRRVIQKFDFLEADLDLPAAPGEAELRGWYDSHRSLYAKPNRVSFSHIFFAADAGDDAGSRERAEAVRARLSSATERAPELGDSFPDLADFSRFGPDEARRLFGDGELTQQLFKAPIGLWQGPWRSSFGWHLVRVSGVELQGMQSFDTVRERVKSDWLNARREEARRKRETDLLKSYTVVRQ
ncbi:MAG: peptidyl-prolyl cis-trans isomerase [Novosphingobium sp.]